MNSNFTFPPPPPPPPRAATQGYGHGAPEPYQHNTQGFRGERGGRGGPEGRGSGNSHRGGGRGRGGGNRGGGPSNPGFYSSGPASNGYSNRGARFTAQTTMTGVAQPYQASGDAYPRAGSYPLPEYPASLYQQSYQSPPVQYVQPTLAAVPYQNQYQIQPSSAPVQSSYGLNMQQIAHTPNTYTAQPWTPRNQYTQAVPQTMGPPIRMGFDNNGFTDAGRPSYHPQAQPFVPPPSGNHYGSPPSYTGNKRKREQYSDHSHGPQSDRSNPNPYPPRFQSQQRNSNRTGPKVASAPAVPGFGPPLPSKPAPSPSQGPSNPKKKKKSHNQLGLTPRTESHEESEDEDADEEATFAATSQELKFEYRGQTSTLGSSADIAAWIEERRKRFPTKQRIEERKEEGRKRIDQRKEAQQAQQRAHNQESQRKRKERKTKVEQNDNEQRKKAIEKHLIKAEKLRRKLKKSEEKAARAAMSLGSPSSLEGGADTVKLDDHGSPWIKLEGDQDQGLPCVDEGQLQNPSSLNIDTEGAHIMTIKPEFNEDLFSSSAWNLDEAITRTSSTFRFSSFLPHPPAPRLFDDDDGSSDMSISSSSEDPSSESDDSSDDEAPEEASSRRNGPTRVPPPVRERGICKFFLRMGRCRIGARCHFRHELPERSTKSTANKDQGRDKSKRTEGKRKTLHQRLLEQEEEEENRLALQVIKQLGDNGFFEGA
ncbi:hypothetical protein BJ546DRAFT_1064593 [Cryomyces antarcticus]